MASTKLTVLACSGSVLAITLFAQPGQSATLSTTVVSRLDRTTPLVSIPQIDRHHQLAAIDRVGCGCQKCSGDTRDGAGSGTI